MEAHGEARVPLVVKPRRVCQLCCNYLGLPWREESREAAIFVLKLTIWAVIPVAFFRIRYLLIERKMRRRFTERRPSSGADLK